MSEEKKHAQDTGEHGGPSSPGNVPPNAGDERLERLETLLMDRMAGIASSIAELGAGGGAGANPANQYHTLNARLSLLEENFARICTVVGRLDQELQQLKNASSGRKE